ETVVIPPPLPRFDPPPSIQEIPPPPEPVPLETTFGLNWITRIAVLTLLLGAAFLFKYGVDNNWFGPAARVVLGVATAAVALFAGGHSWRRGEAVVAPGVIR